MSFFDEFNHIVPYFIKVNIGKNRSFKTDANKKSPSNHKGKMVAFYKKAKTLEELEKYGLGEYIEYLPAEQVSMPIDIQVVCDENITPIFEKSSKYTNKKITCHDIRIFNSDKVQIGYVSLSLTPSGDIDEKTSFYESPDGTEKIMHIIYNEMSDGKLIKDDIFEFQKNSKEGTTKVRISQRNGRIVGCSVLEQEIETKEDVMFQSITQFSKDEKTPKLKRYVASCLDDEPDFSKRGGKLIPWECMTLEDDLADESNNRLRAFKGDYIGNILKLTDKGYEACIVTKHQKDGCDYRLYTLIDLTGTSITQGTGLDEFACIDRDPNYFEKLDSADKTPTFVTRIDRDGQEELVLFGGKAVSRECPEYDEFVKDFISPLSKMNPIQISKVLNKQSEKEK